MKILEIFNRYAHMGGEEIAVAQISAELAKHHEFRSITFDSQDWATETGMLSRFKQFLSMAWNPSSTRLVREQIEEFQPDIVLLHNIMPIGSAGLFVYLSRCGVPVVQFIHNFRPFSVNGYCWGNGRLLPQGLNKNFFPEILAGAWQNSIFKTAWYGFLIRLLHVLGVYDRIRGWIAISNFMKERFIEGGIDENRIQVISHSWEPQCSECDLSFSNADSSEPSFLFLGRLTEEKGLRVLLDAWEIFETSSPNGHLMIAGDGPMTEEVALRCEAMGRATYLGFQSGDAKRQLLRDCTALVVPSIWWEPSGLVLYEAYDYGKPVLAARSGGIVDHVEDGITGWIHEPGDAATLAAQMLETKANPEECVKRGANGREYLLRRSSSVWIHDFDDFVGRVIAEAKGGDVCAPEQPPEGNDKPPHSCRESGNQVRESVSEKTSGNESKIKLLVYLADQNPGHDRSFGISRMSHLVMDSLQTGGKVEIEAIASRTSQQAPASVKSSYILPWGTRSKWVRLLTDHSHPLFALQSSRPDAYYFPKGYLPLLSRFCRPSVVTIHDTIIQYDEDHYPKWRTSREYAYWAMMLKHTLKNADLILTVSESSKVQIQAFMNRHGIPGKPIHVTYEPCHYESIPQPLAPEKENFVIHLASVEPHKRTAQLIRWWHEAESQGRKLPFLHLIGTVPPEALPMLEGSHLIVKRPFLEDQALQSAYRAARALILPSEVEGFGLPALEAYYLGTPVCFVKGTSVDEILSASTQTGGFSLEDAESLFSAIDEVISMTPDAVRDCGLKLRRIYAAKDVARRMHEAIREAVSE